jgi:hypothetical protein
MKNFSTLLLLWLCWATATSTSGQEINKSLKPFDKIIASPKINVILQQGENEEIRLVYNNITADKVNIEVNHHTLRIYLDDAKFTEKLERLGWNEKRSIYRDATITAYVTYRNLKHIEIRGNQELTCYDPLRSEKFVLKAYGENEINLASVKTDYLKTSLYGENKLKIQGGRANYQKYKLYGQNKIDTQKLQSYEAMTQIFGESKIKLTTQDALKVTSFGESEVSYNGDATVTKGLVFGKSQITKLDLVK